MKLTRCLKLKKLMQKMQWFGYFDMTLIRFNHLNSYKALTTVDQFNKKEDYQFSKRFMHFMQLITPGQTRLCMQRQNIWLRASVPLSKHRLLFIKKENNEITLFVFHSSNRDDLIRLMLHQESIKRMATYIQENSALLLERVTQEPLHRLFGLHEQSIKCDIHRNKHYVIEEILKSHLTKKEIRYVHAYWLHRSVQIIASSAGLSRSYVNNILLSSAHKLGLGRVQDLLTLHHTNSILLQREKPHATRHHRY